MVLHPVVMLQGVVWLAGVDLSLKAACPLVQKRFGLSDDLCKSTTVVDLAGMNSMDFNQTIAGLPTPEAVQKQAKVKAISSLVLTLLFSVIGALLWKSKIADPKLKDETTTLANQLEGADESLKFKDGDWKYGIFSCFGDMNYCLHGFCCYPCMAADLFSVNAGKSYWQIWFIVTLPSLLTSIVNVYLVMTTPVGQTPSESGNSSFAVLNIIIALSLTGPTNKIRETLGGSANFPKEFVGWWLCACCSVIQKQRQVDEVRKDRLGCLSVDTNVKAREVGEAFIVDMKEPLVAV